MYTFTHFQKKYVSLLFLIDTWFATPKLSIAEKQRRNFFHYLILIQKTFSGGSIFRKWGNLSLSAFLSIRRFDFIIFKAFNDFLSFQLNLMFQSYCKLNQRLEIIITDSFSKLIYHRLNCHSPWTQHKDKLTIDKRRSEVNLRLWNFDKCRKMNCVHQWQEKSDDEKNVHCYLESKYYAIHIRMYIHFVASCKLASSKN